MSDHGHEHNADWAKGEVYEGDMDAKANAVVAAWAVVLTGLFFATVFALIPYFHWERDFVMEAKVNKVESEDLAKLRSEEQQWLTATEIPEGGQGMDIDAAKAQVIKDLSEK